MSVEGGHCELMIWFYSDIQFSTIENEGEMPAMQVYHDCSQPKYIISPSITDNSHSNEREWTKG